jgi:hypothetical protein
MSYSTARTVLRGLGEQQCYPGYPTLGSNRLYFSAVFSTPCEWLFCLFRMRPTKHSRDDPRHDRDAVACWPGAD